MDGQEGRKGGRDNGNSSGRVNRWQVLRRDSEGNSDVPTSCLSYSLSLSPRSLPLSHSCTHSCTHHPVPPHLSSPTNLRVSTSKYMYNTPIHVYTTLTTIPSPPPPDPTSPYSTLPAPTLSHLALPPPYSTLPYPTSMADTATTASTARSASAAQPDRPDRPAQPAWHSTLLHLQQGLCKLNLSPSIT